MEKKLNKGKLAVISGPSGVGQDTIIDLFIKKHPDWWLSVSTTTRSLVRPGEIKGKDMIFVTPEEFGAQQERNEFLESFKFADFWYATPQKPVKEKLSQGINVIIRPEFHGAMAIKALYPEAKLIFINAENSAALEKRLRERHTENEIEIQHRLEANKEKLKHINKYDHVVINPTDHPEKAVAELERILIDWHS